MAGRTVFSHETGPPELPSEREDSEARWKGGATAVGRCSEVALSPEGLGSAGASSSARPGLFLCGVRRFRSIDLRRVLERSAEAVLVVAVAVAVEGSKERRRRLSCCSRLRLGVGGGTPGSVSTSASTSVGAVVMMAGAAGQGQSGACYARCSLTYAGRRARRARRARRVRQARAAPGRDPWPWKTAASRTRGGSALG